MTQTQQTFLTSQKIKQFSELFVHYDYYATGTIHYTSLKQILANMLIQMNQQDLITLVNESGNQNPTMIKLDEFLAIMSIVSEDKDMSKEIASIFKLFDLDKSKTINRADIKRALDELKIAINEEEIDNMLKYANKKSLNLREFQQFMMKDV